MFIFFAAPTGAGVIPANLRLPMADGFQLLPLLRAVDGGLLLPGDFGRGGTGFLMDGGRLGP